MLKKRLTALLTVAFLFMATIPVNAKPLRVYLRSKTDANEIVYINYSDYMRAYASRNEGFREVLAGYDVAGVAVENDDNKKIKVIDYSEYAKDYYAKSATNMDDYADNEDAVGYKNPEKVKVLSKDGALSGEVEAPDKPENIIPVDYINISEARAKAKGEIVTIKGTVSGVIGNNVFIQDSTAGIYIYMGATISENLNLGNTVKIKGILDEYNGLKQIKYVENETVIDFIEKGTEAAPQEITADKIGEEYESELISVKNLTITSVGTGTAGYDVKAKDDNNNIVNIRIDKHLLPYIDSSNFKTNSIIHVTAPVSEFTKSGGAVTYQLMLRSLSDVTVIKEGDGEVPPPVTKTIREIQGKAHRSPFENHQVTAIKGVVTAISSVDRYQKGFFMQDANPDNDAVTSEGIFVSHSSLSSIKVGDAVEVDGTVKEIVNGTNEDGAPETVINATKVVVKSSKNPLPEAIVINLEGSLLKNVDDDNLKSFDINEDAMDYFESLEGMLVKIVNPLIIGSTEKYGEIYVVPNSGAGSEHQITVNGGIRAMEDDFNPEAITIDDIIHPITSDSTKQFIDPNMKIKTGDKFASNEIAGVMSYGFGKYKVINTEKLPSILPEGKDREVTSIDQVDNKLTIATYNVENFHKGVGNRIQKLAETIVTNLKTPDIIGLIEVQDNNGASSGTTEANESYMALINAIKALGGPEYGYTDVSPVDGQDGGEPGGNIRPGFIYRKDRVTLVNKPRGTATVGVAVSENGLSVNPGRIDPTNGAFANSRKPQVAEFEFKGEKVFVIANHLNSKGGDQSLFGINQPPVRSSEVQRHKQAAILNSFVKDLQAKIPDANIVTLGDMNDFEFSETLRILKGNEMINMIEELPEEERFTYNFNGNSQVLDHILVSNNLKAKTIADIVCINSQFTEDYGRVSDHDPVLIQMDLGVTERTDQEILNEALDSLSLGDVSAVISDLTLPSALGNGVTAVWTSSDESVISNNGKVTRPEVGQNNAVVTLTATLSKGSETATKIFEVTVLAKVEIPQGDIIFEENFDNISSWTDAEVNGSGVFTVNDSKFVSGTAGGVQKGVNAIVMLTTAKTIADLRMNLDLKNATKAELSFDWSKVINPQTNESNPRILNLNVSYTIDNNTFVELVTAAVVKNNSTPETGKFIVTLPEEVYGKQVTIRFTALDNGGSGNRPKIEIDNILVK